MKFGQLTDIPRNYLFDEGFMIDLNYMFREIKESLKISPQGVSFEIGNPLDHPNDVRGQIEFSI